MSHPAYKPPPPLRFVLRLRLQKGGHICGTQCTIYFAACFVRLLFEGGVYFFGKPDDGWIGLVRVRRWWLLDAVSSMRSLSVLLSAVERTRTTQTVLVLAWWPLSAIIHTRVHVQRLLVTGTIRGRRLFRSRGSDCAATIRRWLLFKEILWHFGIRPLTFWEINIYPSFSTN